MMVGFERKYRKNSEENQSLPNNLETDNEIVSHKNGITEELNTFFMNIGPYLAIKIP